MDNLGAAAELCEDATDEFDDRLCADDDTLDCDDDSKDEDLLEESDDETTEEEIADDDDLTEEDDTAGADELAAGGVSWESDPPPQAESTAAKLHAIKKLKLCFI